VKLMPVLMTNQCNHPPSVLRHRWFGRPVWTRERCRISPPHFLAECRKKQLNQTDFVLLYFVLFAFSGLSFVFVVCLFLICILSRIFQRVPTRMALCNCSGSLIMVMCC